MEKLKLKLHQISHWEYWPFGVVYFPMYFVWLYYAIRLRSFFFGTAANPTIMNGGFLMESKREIYQLIPEQYYPKTYYWDRRLLPDENCDQVAGLLSYPVIVKPDIGMRGKAIQKIEDAEMLKRYAASIAVDFMVQEFISYPEESGVFYVRIPGQPKGRITGIVSKEFLSVTGDGRSTLQELIKVNPRYHFQFEELRKQYGNEMDRILPKGEMLMLVPFGNHSRGAKFIDDSASITEELTSTIDSICQQIPGFYFGRLDIKFTNKKDLSSGNNFKIIELNGAGSEPTHIYDPKHSIWYAWKEISRHLSYLYEISKANSEKGYHPITLKAGLSMLSQNKRHMELLNGVK